jgi:UDP-glucose 4-epimerase
MTPVLVTGCAGFIGSHLCEALLEAGTPVRGVDAFTDYYPRDLKERNLEGVRSSEHFTLLDEDIVTADLDRLIEGCSGVYHLAAQPGVRGSFGETFARYAHDNILATQRIFEAAARAGVRVVWASSSSVYGNAASHPTPEHTRPAPISPYGVTKITCEHLAGAYEATSGLVAVAMRYFTVYGPRQRPDMAFTRVAHALATGAPFPLFGSGRQTRDVTYVADAVSATIAAMASGVPGAAYNVGGGSETSLLDAIGILEDLAGDRLLIDAQPGAAGDVQRTSADTARARQDLAWAPTTSIEDGLRNQLTWAFDQARVDSPV